MMEQNLAGLSRKQKSDCRAALQRFINRHEISDWETTIKAEKEARRKYRLKIEITPPAETGLQRWAFKEIAVADRNLNIAAEMDEMLELAYQERFAESRMQ